MRKILSLVAVVVVVSSSSPRAAPSNGRNRAAPSSSSDPFPVTVEAGNGSGSRSTRRPTRSCRSRPRSTEMLFAVGAGDQVDSGRRVLDLPRRAPTPTCRASSRTSRRSCPTTRICDIGYRRRRRREWPGGSGRARRLLPAAETLDETYAQIEQLGIVTGHAEEAAEVAADVRDRDRRDRRFGAARRGAMTVYHELDDTYYSVTTDTFIGQVYEMFGLANIADEAKGAGSGYPQLSSEYIVDPDPALIVLADGECCGQSRAANVADRPGWSVSRLCRGFGDRDRRRRRVALGSARRGVHARGGGGAGGETAG